MNKRGLEQATIVKWIIALTVLIVVILGFLFIYSSAKKKTGSIEEQISGVDINLGDAFSDLSDSITGKEDTAVVLSNLPSCLSTETKEANEKTLELLKQLQKERSSEYTLDQKLEVKNRFKGCYLVLGNPDEAAKYGFNQAGLCDGSEIYELRNQLKIISNEAKSKCGVSECEEIKKKLTNYCTEEQKTQHENVKSEIETVSKELDCNSASVLEAKDKDNLLKAADAFLSGKYMESSNTFYSLAKTMEAKGTSQEIITMKTQFYLFSGMAYSLASGDCEKILEKYDYVYDSTRAGTGTLKKELELKLGDIINQCPLTLLGSKLNDMKSKVPDLSRNPTYKEKALYDWATCYLNKNKYEGFKKLNEFIGRAGFDNVYRSEIEVLFNSNCLQLSDNQEVGEIGYYQCMGDRSSLFVAEVGGDSQFGFTGANKKLDEIGAGYSGNYYNCVFIDMGMEDDSGIDEGTCMSCYSIKDSSSRNCNAYSLDEKAWLGGWNSIDSSKDNLVNDAWEVACNLDPCGFSKNGCETSGNSCIQSS
ncbi:MAG: hypothetical protein PHE43_00405 [Candidatus Nanoarchaeia archaeon]|nr:hypothetical protein [Candidatus Nanoarchaeia archaeon]